MKIFIFVFLFFIISCSKAHVVKEPERISEDYGRLSTYGPIVYLKDKKNDEFTLHFYTEKPEKSKVKIFKPSGDEFLEEKTNYNFHYFNLKKVNELTVFQIFSSEDILNKKIIKITIPHRTPYKFAIFGGYIENQDKYKSFANLLGDYLPVFTLHTGELVKNSRNLTQWTSFLNNSSDFLVNTIFIPALNIDKKGSEIIEKVFSNPEKYRTYNYPSIKIIVLDVYSDFRPASTQYEFIESELKNSGFLWKVVLINENPFLSTSDETVKNINKYLLPLFEKYRVNLVVCPGKKGFARYVKDNVTYISTSCSEKFIKSEEKKYLVNSIDGEENFLICEALQKRLLFKVYNIKNEVVDEFQVIE